MKFSKLVFLLLLMGVAYAQVRDKGAYVSKHSEYWDQVIQKEIDANKPSETKDSNVFKMDLSGYKLPGSIQEFNYQWHTTPVNQGNTGTCWSFSTTSFYESEIYRVHKRQVKLSPMFTAYWEYVEKAMGFVESRGKSVFGQGSEANALKRVWKKYGVVPESAYSGLQPGRKVHDHTQLFEEMNNYLQFIKQTNDWNPEKVASTIKAILNHYMPAPPEKFTYDGAEYTPIEFFNKVVDLNMDDYYEVTSLMYRPYYSMIEYEVPDNWWHSKEYYNLPLDVFMKVFKESIHKGYTMALGGDVSEPGLNSAFKVAMIPSFDIPSEYIDESARQMRFNNKSTDDDHGIHVVGYGKNTAKDGKEWFLIKDSGSGAYNTGDKGYIFYHEDYVKLKMLGFTVHKDILAKYMK
ncbi:MAG: peptidase C1 [Ignavibacteria bacterium]|nr:peptidase C1 [Ignavibacteria bacterium]